MSRPYIYISAALILLGLSAPFAQAQPLCPMPPVPERPVAPLAAAADDIHMSADQAETQEDGVSLLRGQAEISRAGEQLRADQIEYRKQEHSATLSGNVEYWQSNAYVSGERADVDFGEETGHFGASSYVLFADGEDGEDGEERERLGQGTAQEGDLYFQRSTTLRNASYTTCDLTDPAWSLHAAEIRLNHETRQGVARNMLLRVHDVPVFYTPWIRFPLHKERTSGFLAPSFGNSNRNGFELQVPWYWNISPSRDMTFAPRLFSDNGVMWSNEFRYLAGPHGNGAARVEYLPDDNGKNGEDRSFVSFLHRQSLFQGRMRALLKFRHVSDQSYLDDFGDTLALSSERMLDRLADFRFSGHENIWNGHWSAALRVQDHQSLDIHLLEEEEPYKRLPQLLFQYHSPYAANGLRHGVGQEWTHFTHSDDRRNITGHRYDISPYVSYRISNAAAFLEPKIQLRYTRYSLEHPSGEQPSGSPLAAYPDPSPDRLAPLLRVDSGLFLERMFQIADREYFQTLEPRLQYLYVPATEQDDLPVFDAGPQTHGLQSLFRDNRFHGKDRIGDDSRIAASLRTRIAAAEHGRTLLELTAGQAFHLRDREATLPRLTQQQQALQQSSKSPLFTEWRLSSARNWDLRGEWQWNHHRNDTEKFVSMLRYRPDPGQRWTVGYREQNETYGNAPIRQFEASFQWRLNPRWSLAGRWSHSLEADEWMEAFAGMEYNGCCLRLRTVMRRFLTDNGQRHQTGVFFEVELKGLTQLGKDTARFFRPQSLHDVLP